MKVIMKNIIILLLLGVGLPAMAQQPESEETQKGRVEALKVAFITEKLNLTTKEAEVFWPVFNKYDKEVKGLRKKERETAKAYSEKQDPTDQEAEKFLTEQMALKQQEIDLLKKYLPEFKKVLPATKVARLLSLEQEFKIQLLHKLRDKRGGRQ
jgi:hypothetical protein